MKWNFQHITVQQRRDNVEETQGSPYREQINCMNLSAGLKKDLILKKCVILNDSNGVRPQFKKQK